MLALHKEVDRINAELQARMTALLLLILEAIARGERVLDTAKDLEEELKAIPPANLCAFPIIVQNSLGPQNVFSLDPSATDIIQQRRALTKAEKDKRDELIRQRDRIELNLRLDGCNA